MLNIELFSYSIKLAVLSPIFSNILQTVNYTSKVNIPFFENSKSVIKNPPDVQLSEFSF